MFKHSDDADVRQLAIFETPSTNTSVLEKRFLNIHPVSGITPNTNVIHFCIKVNDLKYIDLQKTQLYVRCKILDKDGHPTIDEIPRDRSTSTIPRGDEEAKATNSKEVAFPINHLLQSMWKQVEVYLGGKLVSAGSTNYHYKSMIKTLLYRCQDEGMKQKLCSELFYEDTKGTHDSLNNSPMNLGSFYHKELTVGGETFEMEGPLNEDTFNLGKYLINGVNLDLKLYPARSAFALMSNSPNKEYSIIIEEAILKCYTIEVSSTIVSAHTQSMEKAGMAQYFFNQAQLNSFTIPKGISHRLSSKVISHTR